jgi:hypothetical protein
MFFVKYQKTELKPSKAGRNWREILGKKGGATKRRHLNFAYKLLRT